MKRISNLEYKYVKEVLDSQFCSSRGAVMMTRFEKKFSEIFDAKFAISAINGTATLHIALEAAGIHEGDEVIVPPLTMSSTTFAVLQANATPVFADVDLDTFQISAEEIEKKITPRTKAIITVALYGLSAELDKILAIAKKHGLFLLEDNAECFMGMCKGKFVGKWGDAASFSFQSSKHLTSGEGGILITDNEELALKFRRVSSLGYAGVGAQKGKITKDDIQSPDYSRHVSMGWNYRMPELCAAVALAQTERIVELVECRKKTGELFNQVCEGCSFLKPQLVPQGYVNSYWTWAAVLDTDYVSWKTFRQRFLEFGGAPFYAAWKLAYREPMFTHLQLLYREKFIDPLRCKEYQTGILCPNAEYLQPRLIQLKTNYWNFDEAEKQAVILKKTIQSF